MGRWTGGRDREAVTRENEKEREREVSGLMDWRQEQRNSDQREIESERERNQVKGWMKLSRIREVVTIKKREKEGEIR